MLQASLLGSQMAPPLRDCFRVQMSVDLNAAVILDQGSALLQCDLILISDTHNDPMAK